MYKTFESGKDEDIAVCTGNSIVYHNEMLNKEGQQHG